MKITLRCPDDAHLHVRDEAALDHVVPQSAAQFSRAIIMPNLRPPVTTVQAALDYQQRILAALNRQMPQGAHFQPLMTLYLTDHTEPGEIYAAKESGQVMAVKLYPAGATTNSQDGVTNLKNVYPTLEAMQMMGIPLLVHGEVTDPSIDLFDREARFIEDVLIPLRHDFPDLKIVMEHMTTREAVDYVSSAEGKIAGTITPQHLLYNRNAIFMGGVRPHYYCLPVLKRETHRLALVEAATSGNPRFFLGTDSAPHATHLKEAAVGCAGCYTGLHALALYATVFDAVGKLDRLEAFASEYFARFYGLPLNEGTVTLEKEPFEVPAHLPYMNGSTLTPLAAGETLPWRLVGKSFE